jgi:hypothetical protein
MAGGSWIILNKKNAHFSVPLDSSETSTSGKKVNNTLADSSSTSVRKSKSHVSVEAMGWGRAYTNADVPA